MSRLSCTALWIGLAVLAVALPLQAREARFLKHAVGDTITAAEAIEYQLFTDTPGFIRAVFDHSEYTSHRELRVRYGDPVQEKTAKVDKTLLDLLPQLLERATMDAAARDTVPGPPVSVYRKDKDRFDGRLVAWHGWDVTLRHEYGDLRIPVDDIDDLDLVITDQVADERYWFKDPNRNRLLVFPTARKLEPGHGQFGLHEILLPMLRVGLPLNISVGGGAFPFSNPDGGLAWALGKVTVYESERWVWAAGAAHAWTKLFLTGEDQFGAVYGIGTYGNSISQVTVGAGRSFEAGRGLDPDPFVIIGGTHRSGRNLALVTEHWILKGGDGYVGSLGLRLFSSYFAADIAMVWTRGDGNDDVLFPLLNLVGSF